MDDTPVLHVGSEADGDLVEITSQDGSVPDGGGIEDIHSASHDRIGGDIGVHSNVGDDVVDGEHLALAAVVPFDTAGAVDRGGGVVRPEGLSLHMASGVAEQAGKPGCASHGAASYRSHSHWE